MLKNRKTRVIMLLTLCAVLAMSTGALAKSFQEMETEMGPFYTWSLEDKAEMSPQTDVGGNPLPFIHGLPSDGDIPQAEAIEIARKAITEKYGLTSDTLGALEAYVSFNVADPESTVWQIDFLPKEGASVDASGYYCAEINARTSSVIALYSDAEANG